MTVEKQDEPQQKPVERRGGARPGSGRKPTELGQRLLVAKTKKEEGLATLRHLEVAAKKGELVDRAQALEHVFRLAREERDAWLNWPARISSQMAVKLGVDAHMLHVTLEAAVREHLQELGEVRPRVD